MKGMMSLIVVVVMVLAALPNAESVKCYACTGYISDAPAHDVDNNKNCPSSNFDASKLHTDTGDACLAIIEEYNGQKITVRGPQAIWYAAQNRTRSSKNKITVKGYFCDTDYCNKDNPASAAPTHALCLPLLLAACAVSLKRFLA